MAVQNKGRSILDRDRVLFWGGLIFSLTQLLLPIFMTLIDLQLRAIHIINGISLASLDYPY